MRLAGWGRVCAAETLACRPERLREVAAALAATPSGGIIARRGGRSYGDAALNGAGRTLLTRRLDRLLAFDPESGLLAAEPGVTLGELVRIFAPRGFLPPVVPGTGFATLGGAVAMDVHGKNHDRAGSFGDHLAWLDLMGPSGEVRRLAPGEPLFAATVGGAGLTGVVTALALRLVRAPAAVGVRERRIGDLDGFLAGLAEARATATYSVGWIDALARGRGLGRGILETAEPVEAPPPAPARGGLAIPCEAPGWLLNKASVAAFNVLYRRRVPRGGGRERVVPVARFFFPLDALCAWNRLYGRAGFHQFQCVLPDAHAETGARRLLETVAKGRPGAFLAVIKTLGGEGRGLLSFPMPGVTLAFDVPRRGGAEALLDACERIVRDAGGRVYLAKDARLSAAAFAEMYPRLEAFREALAIADPNARMGSDLARRLRMREP